MRIARPVAPLLLALVALAGCGNERFEPRSLALDPSTKSRTVRYPSAGLTMDLPLGFGVRPTRRPGVFRGTLREVFVSAFAYRRAEQLPRNDEELRVARRRLERTIKGRAKGYELVSARTARVGGARTIEVLGEQTLSGRRLRTRSLHVFKGSVEYVIELAAPVAAFPRVDRVTTPIVKRSLKVTGKLRKPARSRDRR